MKEKRFNKGRKVISHFSGEDVKDLIERVLVGWNVGRKWKCSEVNKAVEKVNMAEAYRPFKIELYGLKGLSGRVFAVNNGRKFVMYSDRNKEQE